MPLDPKMIITDDDASMLALYKRVFGGLGVTIFATTDSDEALRVASYSPPDLFMTDLMHPGANGIEMVRAIRENERTKDTSIWIVSGSLGRMSKEQLQQLDVDMLINKPVPFSFLFENAQQIFKSKNKDLALLELGSEAPDLDYKLDIDLGSKDGRASFAKDVIAFANYGGGRIIVGVKEARKGCFEYVGIDETNFEKFEVTTLNKAIVDYVEPAHHISSHRIYKGRTCFEVITIPATKESPLLARKENAKAGLFLGRIYTRSSCAETKEITQSKELWDLLSRFSPSLSDKDMD